MPALTLNSFLLLLLLTFALVSLPSGAAEGTPSSCSNIDFDKDHPSVRPVTQRSRVVNVPPATNCPLGPSFEDLTHYEYLAARSGPADFDDDRKDYDLFLRLMDDVGLPSTITNNFPDKNTTLLVPTDDAVRVSAYDILKYMRKQSSNAFSALDLNLANFSAYHPHALSEQQAYDIINTFMSVFADRTVLTIIIRNHLIPLAISLCDAQFYDYWTAISGRKIVRRGTALCTGNEVFPFARLNLSILGWTAQGYIQSVDRMVIPNLSPFPFRTADQPADPLQPDASPGVGDDEFDDLHQGQDVQYLPVPSIPIPGQLWQPSPSFSADNVTSNNNNSNSNSSESTYFCFPASATLSTNGPHGRLTTMSRLQHGQLVQSSSRSRSSRVFLFSHRDRSTVTRFVKLTTASNHSVTLSPGHFIYARRVDAASVTVAVPAAQVMPGDLLQTGSHSWQTVVRTQDVYDYGLYAPHTMDGDVMVNGVRASCYTTATGRSIAVPHALLTPVRAVMRVWYLEGAIQRRRRGRRGRRRGIVLRRNSGVGSTSSSRSSATEVVDDDDDVHPSVSAVVDGLFDLFRKVSG